MECLCFCRGGLCISRFESYPLSHLVAGFSAITDMMSKPKAPALLLVDKQRSFARVIDPYLTEEMRAHFDTNSFHYRDRYIREFTADSSPPKSSVSPRLARSLRPHD